MDANVVTGILVAAAFGCAYLFPAMVAFSRHHRQFAAIFVLNLLLGWTLFGWVLALVWAVTRERE